MIHERLVDVPSVRIKKKKTFVKFLDSVSQPKRFFFQAPVCVNIGVISWREIVNKIYESSCDI